MSRRRTITLFSRQVDVFGRHERRGRSVLGLQLTRYSGQPLWPLDLASSESFCQAGLRGIKMCGDVTIVQDPLMRVSTQGR
jgi:hypothetical protein